MERQIYGRQKKQMRREIFERKTHKIITEIHTGIYMEIYRNIWKENT